MNSLEWWPMLFGWPALLAGLALAGSGVLRHRPAWLTIATIVVLPVSLYLAYHPRPGWVVLIVPVALAGAGIAVQRGRFQLAWFLLGPLVGLVAWLAVIMLSR